MTKMKHIGLAITLSLLAGLCWSAQAATTRSVCYSFQGQEAVTAPGSVTLLGTLSKTVGMSTIPLGSLTATINYDPSSGAISGGSYVFTMGTDVVQGSIPAGGTLPLDVNGVPSGSFSIPISYSNARFSVSGFYVATLNGADGAVSASLCLTIVSSR